MYRHRRIYPTAPNMASGINIYSQLLISTIRIVDISKSNCWYQQLKLLISTIRITDINNNCHLQQFVLLISTIRIVHISNSNCWYQQFKLLISTIRITDINNYCWYQQLIVDINNTIVDINNSNCWYQQLWINVNSACHTPNWFYLVSVYLSISWEYGGGGHCLVRMEWNPAGWSVCLPLLIFPCTIKSRSSLLALAHPGGPGEMAVQRL